MLNVLDGSLDEQKKSSEMFLNTLTKEEKEEAVSDKYAYLDED